MSTVMYVLSIVWVWFFISSFAHDASIHDVFDPDCPGVQRTLRESATKLQNEFRRKMIPFYLEAIADPNNGGGYVLDYGTTSPTNTTHRQLVNQARTLHALSLLHNLNSTPEWHKTDLLSAADQGYMFLESAFHDGTNGGYYWSVDTVQGPTNRNKNTEGHLALISAYLEYARAKGNASIAERAQKVFDMLYRRIQDSEFGGYYADFEADWTPIEYPREGGPASSFGLKKQSLLVSMLETLTQLYVEVERTLVGIALEKILDDDVALFFPMNPNEAVESRLWNLREYRVGGSMSYGVYAQYITARVAAEEALGRDIDWKTFDIYLNYCLNEGILLGGLMNNGQLVWWASDTLMNALSTAIRYNRSDKEQRDHLQSLFHFQTCYLIDPQHGFSLWSVDRRGHPSYPVIFGPWKSGLSEIQAKINLVDTILNGDAEEDYADREEEEEE